MAIISPSGEFPRVLTFIGGAVGIFVGLFSFIFSCILAGFPEVIMLSMVITAIGIVLILTGANIFRIYQSNIPLTLLLTVSSIISAFINFVRFCIITSVNVLGGSVFAVSIVLILLLLGLMAFYVLFFVMLVFHLQKTAPGCCSTSTTVTSTSRTTTATTIETPPASYPNHPVS